MSAISKETHQPFDESIQPPLFLATPTVHFETVQEASPFFLSLVRYIEEGNTLDYATLRKAEIVLERLVSLIRPLSSNIDLLSSFAPRQDNSAEGFAEAILTLLTSGYKSLVNLSLHLLRYAIHPSPQNERLSFIDSGFFTRLAPTPQWIEGNLSSESLFNFVNTILSCTTPALPENIQEISRLSTLSIESVHQIILEQLLQPLLPFVSYSCENRSVLEFDTQNLPAITRLLILHLELGIYHEPTLSFIFSHHICHAVMQHLLSLEQDLSALICHLSLNEINKHLRHTNLLVRTRWKALLCKLNEEGLADGLDTFSFWEVLFSSIGKMIRKENNTMMIHLAVNHLIDNSSDRQEAHLSSGLLTSPLASLDMSSLLSTSSSIQHFQTENSESDARHSIVSQIAVNCRHDCPDFDITAVADILSTLPFRMRCDCSNQPACPLSDLPHTHPSTTNPPRTFLERFCRNTTPILPPMNPVTPDISHFASEIVKKEFTMAELDYAQSIVKIVQDPQPGLMQFGRIEIDRGRGHLTLPSSTRLVSWSTFWKTIMKERIILNRTFFISLFVDCVQSVFRRHKLGLGQEVLSEDDIFLDVECNIEMLQVNAHSFLRNEPNSQLSSFRSDMQSLGWVFQTVLDSVEESGCFEEPPPTSQMRHRINEFIADTIRRLASTRVVEFVDGSEQKVSGIDFIGLASELDIPEWNDETGLFSTNEHAAGKDSLSPEEMFLASSESGVYCLNGIVRWLLEENMLRSEGPFLDNVKALTRRIVSMRFGELEGESWRKETERWLCFQELVLGIVGEEIDPTDLQFLQNGCLASAFDLLEARTQIEQPADLHFVEQESKGQFESDVETSSSNASDSLRASLPSTQSTLSSDSSSEHATSLQDDMSREGDQIELEIEDPSSTILNFTFPDQSSPQNRQKLNLMRHQWIFDASSPHIVVDHTSSLPSSSLLVKNTPLSHNPIILTEPINEDAFIPTPFTHLAFLLNSDNPTLRTQSYMLVTLLSSSPTHAPYLRHTRKAIRDSVSDLTIESRLAFSTIPLPTQLDPSLIPHDEPSKTAAIQQFLKFGEQVSAMAPIAAPKSLDEIPQFLSEIGRLGKNDFAPLASFVKNLDGPFSSVEQALPFFPPQLRAQIFNNVTVTCVTQKLSFPSSMTNFYVSQSDPTVDQLIGGLPSLFAETLPPIFKKSFPGDVFLERAVRASFADPNFLTFKLAAIALNSFIPEPHLEKIHPLLLRGFHVSLLSFDETHRGLMNDAMLEVFITDPLFAKEGRITKDIFKTHPPPQMSGFVNTAIDLIMKSTNYTLFFRWQMIDNLINYVFHYTLTFGAWSETRLLVLLFTHSPLKQFIWESPNNVNSSMVATVFLSFFGLPPLFETPLLSLFPKDTERIWRRMNDHMKLLRLSMEGGTNLRTMQVFSVVRARATRADWATIFSTPAMVKHILSKLSSPVPALVTATLELLKTAADLRSDAFNRILLSFDAAALVMQAVESSLFLEDYELGSSILTSFLFTLSQ
ncbi:hypothetical protein BLNAU_18871 [Blattamonas nauphoetae]|uniref:Uncharacterized protein n=1 Tax=Blattamonas nauphoetae TaxID=2049346 RepID=A0ABQ9X784_9EUKA|nr:hypothetical protein BLNAU_18871 [Blattamonas nauphoetae]